MTNKFNVNETRENLSRWNLTGSKKDELNHQFTTYNDLYFNHFNYLMNICSNLFVWKNLPTLDGMQIRSSFVEMILSMDGDLCFCKLPEYKDVIVSPCTVVGLLNIIGDPVNIKLSPNYNIYDFESLKKELNAKKDEFVYIRNDNLAVGFYPLINQTCTLLTETLMSFITNVSQQKFPVIVYGTQDSKLTMDIITNKVESWEKYVQVKDNGSFDAKNFGVLNKDMPYVGDKLWQAYTDILNNFYQQIGLNVIPYAKKERLITDEVNANNQAVQTAGDIFLNNRTEGAERVNKMFGLDITVERNTDFIDSLRNNPVPDLEEIGGGNE